MRRAALLCLFLCAASASHAQQLDLFDPDDFVDPRLIDGRVILLSRLVTGVSRGYLDQFRPVGQDIGFVHVTTNVYWQRFHFAYKRSEVRGERGTDEETGGPLFARFGTGGRGSEPAPPPPQPGPKNLLQLSWYQTAGERLTLRYRYAHASQYALPETAARVRGLEDRDETNLLQLDAGLLVGARMQFVSFEWTELTRHSTLAESKQRSLTATALLPAATFGALVLAPRLRIGGIADEGPAIDLINPSLELSLRVPRVGAYVHAIYSPVYRTGGDLQHQVALYADRTLLVLILGGRKGKE